MNKEYDFVQKLIQSYPRHKKQVNRVFESDAEIFEHKGHYLCSSVDTVSEEISMGLVRDPRSLGWLTVAASVSDLAAVGVVAQQLSVLVGRPPHLSDSFLESFKKGVDEASSHFSARLLEFFTFEAQSLITTCTALAIVSEKPKLQRGPLKINDSIFLTGPLGWGNAVAFANLALRSKAPDWVHDIDSKYRPQARCREVSFVNRWAHTCIDTSDGGLFTLYLLSELNDCGIEINYSNDLFHPVAQQVARIANVPLWLFFAAQNGEFELAFAVSETDRSDFLADAQQKSQPIIELGRVTENRNLVLKTPRGPVPLDMNPLKNLLADMTNPDEYILALLRYAESNNI